MQADSAESHDGKVVAGKVANIQEFPAWRPHSIGSGKSLSQQGEPNVPNRLKIDIEQAHHKPAELHYLAVHQAQKPSTNRSQAFHKYNNTIG